VFTKARHSDHRAVWLKLDSALLGSHQQVDIVRAPACRLKCHDPCIVTKCNHYLEGQAHNIPSLLQALFTDHDNEELILSQQELNLIDDMGTKLKHKAEAQFQKIRKVHGHQ